MKEIIELFSNPLVWKLLGGYWIFSSFVGALPKPRESNGVFYETIFRFFHLLAGNVSRAAQTFKLPGAEIQTVKAPGVEIQTVTLPDKDA